MKITYNQFIKAAQSGDTVLMEHILNNTDLQDFSTEEDKNMLYFGVVAFCEAVMANKQEAIDFLLDKNIIDVSYLRKDDDKILIGLLKELIKSSNLRQIDNMFCLIVNSGFENKEYDKISSINFHKLLGVAYNEKSKGKDILDYLLEEEKLINLVDYERIVLDGLLYNELKEKDFSIIKKVLNMPHLTTKDNYNIYFLLDSALQLNMYEVIDYIVCETRHLEDISLEKLEKNLVFSDSKYILSSIQKHKLEKELSQQNSQKVKGKI